MQAASTEPQLIYKRNQLIAFVVEADLFQEFLEWRQHRDQKSNSDIFAEARGSALEEGFVLDVPSRVNRHNPFVDGADVSV